MDVINVSSYAEIYNMNDHTIQKITSTETYNLTISTTYPVSQHKEISTDYYNLAISTTFPVSQHKETITNSHNYILY